MRKFYFSGLCIMLLSLLSWSSANAQRATSYCDCASTSTMFEHITNVTFGDVNNNSARENYGDFTAMSSAFNVGTTFDISVTVDGYDGDYVFVWVDWNKDFDFSDDEKTVLTAAKAQILTGTIPVPAGALPGETRMRVICRYSTEPTPCQSFSFGEVEDYTVNVIADGIFASFKANPQSAGVGEDIVFTDASIGDGITGYTWNFGADATPATATGKGPHTVTYSSEGAKTVWLEVTDGTDTKKTTKDAFVTIVSGSADYAQPKFFGAVAERNVIKMSWMAPNETPKFNNPEGFESGVFPVPGWEIMVSEDINSAPEALPVGESTWTLNSNSTYLHSGSHSASIGYAKKKSNWLITPSITVEAGKQLSFYPYVKNTSSYSSKLNVMIKEGDKAWASALEMGADYESNLMARAEVIDLSAYAGKEIKIAFVQSYTNGYGIAVDDITIEDLASGRNTRQEFRTLKQNSIMPQLDIRTSDNGRERFPIVITRKENNVVKTAENPTGYKVFINGVKKAELAADVREYRLENVVKGDYECSVSAVYAAGESFKLDPITVTTTDPVVDFTVNKTVAGISEDIDFKLSVQGSYTSISWNFGEGATPATSTDKDVTVNYSSLGKKTVTVTINGTIEKKKVEVITIKPGSAEVAPLEGVEVAANYNNVKVTWPSLKQEYKLKEGFEGDWPPANWEIKKSSAIDAALEAPADDAKVWFQCTAASYEGKGATYIKSGEKSTSIAFSAKDFTWLISPEISVADKDKLNFWIWYMNGKASDDVFYHTNFRVMVKADGAWNQALYYTEGTDPNEYESEVSVDLSAYKGKTIQFAFVYEFTDGWQFALDDVSVTGISDKALANDFSKLKVYRDDVVVQEITDADLTEWTDVNLETGKYKYYVTFVNAANKESFPSEEKFVEAYKTLDLPYNEDFEGDVSEWLFNTGANAFKVGVDADFVKDGYSIPAHDGKYVAVNTSDVPGGWLGQTAADIVALPPLNFNGFGRAYFELDYMADIAAFAIIGRETPSAKWEILKQLDKSEAWTTKKVALPAKVLKDGYQLGLYYTNNKATSKGVAFDNIKITTLSGKHLVMEYNGKELASGSDQYLGMIKEGTTKDYTVTLTGIGNEDIDVSNITITDGKFTIKSSPANTTMGVNDPKQIVVTYTPTAETTTADEATITINSNAVETPLTLNISAECGTATWTYMLYLYEDGTGLNGNKDINEWEVLGSIEGKVNYVVLYDCNDDSKDGIYYVTKDPDGMNSTIISPRVSTHLNADIDMNDANTLKNFIIWCKENYPAEKYGCNVWDHGNGIFDRSAPKFKAACGDMLIWDLADAMKAFKEVDGQGFTIFGFDVCLLGQVETVYDIMDYTDIVVASERTEPGDGWDYTTQFNALNANPDMDKYAFADHIVVEYDKSYDNGTQGDRSTTQSAIRTDKFKAEFVPALNAFVDQINPEVYNIKADIKDCIDNAWYSDGDDYKEHKDLGHFLTLLKAKDNVSAETKAKIDELMAAYNNSIIKSLENDHPEATGLKIWIPENISTNPKKHFYLEADKYLSISNTKWDEFLKMYENPVPTGKPTPVFNLLTETEALVGNTAKLQDVTVINPAATGRTWVITPDTYEFVNGTDATSETVEVKFTAAASYTVALTVTNAEGEGTTTKADLITVREPVFIAPKNLAANKNDDTKEVTLTWEEGDEEFPGGVKLDEGFEGSTFPPAGWELTHSMTIDGAQSAPTETGAKLWFHCDKRSFAKPGEPDEDQYIHTGEYSAALGFGAPEFNWMITPEVKIATGDELKFWIWYNNGESSGTYYHTNFRIMVFADGAWNEALFYTDGTDPNQYASEVSVDLSAYDSKKVKVAFVYEFTDGWQLAVDDIKIQAASSDRSPITVNPVVNNTNVERISEASPAVATRVADGTISGYKVYKNNVEIATVTELTYIDNLGNTDGPFEYYVTAVYANPDGESAASNKVVVNNEATKGAKPKDLAATLNKETYDVDLTWSEGDGATGTLKNYKVYRDDKEIATVDGTTYKDNVGSTEATYKYHVTAVYADPVGETEASDKVTVRVTKVISSINGSKFEGLSVYPNPANGGMFNLKLENYDNVRWFLIDVNGIVVEKGIMTGNNTAINVAKSGVYFVKVVSNTQTEIVKVIVK